MSPPNPESPSSPGTARSRTSWHREVPADSVPSASGFRVLPDSRIGDFQMLRILGRGGMGEVWEAEQVSLKRRVALKLLLPERVDAKGLEFFAREARAGARLAHPGIVAVHGSGQDEGLHWIAMEYVPEACDLRHALDAFREEPELPADYYQHVGELVRQIADALEAAHAAGVIHRDLKPANILVGQDDRPRVTDFGLAKVIDEASLSVTGEVAGTYYYMSPEQVAGKRMGLDHRTDIFSLGVILYELLTLTRPFEGDTTEQIAHKILVTEPSAPTELRSRIPADLVVICGKAMEKDPAQRYGSMAELSADLVCFLEGEQIAARPPGLLERARRWTRQHRLQAAVLAAGAAALVVNSSLGVFAFRNGELARVRALELEAQTHALEVSNATLQQRTEEAQAERARAEASERDAREALARSETIRSMLKETIRMHPGVLGELTARAYEELFGIRIGATTTSEEEQEERLAQFRQDLELCSATDVGKRVLVTALLEPLEKRLEQEDIEDPRTEVELRFALADVYYHPLSMFEESIQQRSLALELLLAELGPEEPVTLRNQANLAAVLHKSGRNEEAAELQESLLEPTIRVLGATDPATESLHSNFAMTLQSLGRVEECISIQRQVLALKERRLGQGHHDCLVQRNNLAVALANGGDFEGAEVVLREELELGAEVLEINTSLKAWTLSILGTVLHARGGYDEAEDLLLESIELQEAALGRESPFTSDAVRSLSRVYESQGRHQEAEPLIRECLLLRSGRDGPDSASALGERHRLYRCLRAQERHEEAGELAREVRPVATDDRAFWLQLAAQGFFSGGRVGESIDLQRDAIFLLREAHGEDDMQTLLARLVLAEALVASGTVAEASRLLEELIPAFEAAGLTRDDAALSRALAAQAEVAEAR